MKQNFQKKKEREREQEYIKDQSKTIEAEC